MIVVISCGDKKQSVPTTAAELYTGKYFKDCLRYARSIAKDRDIYIMSAKYGLIRTTRVIAPYNTTMNKHQLTAIILQQQAQALNIIKQPCIFVGGKPYRMLVQQVFKDFYAPFAKAPDGIMPLGACRMGYQRQAMTLYYGQIPRRQQ